MKQRQKRTWWKEGVVYQIYPRSFNDSNQDGIGDLQGIIEKLDYIKSLGVDIIWLCPVYKSPNDDNGYDISDYYDIMDDFGTMDDFDEFLSKSHDLDLKIIMDLVVNHTSDEHEWFKESRLSLDNPKRDYYIWKKGKEGGPPNNWPSFFRGPAWELDSITNEYYLHYFSKKQPDLNWENPKVRQEVYDLMKFWLDKGVDGFRMDVITLISKRHFNDTPYSEFGDIINQLYANGPRVHEYLHEMNQEVLQNYDIMTVGEGPGINPESGLNYVKEDRNELNMMFHFDHMMLGFGPEGRFDPEPIDIVKFKSIFFQWDDLLKKDGWGSIFLGNHDFPRMVSKFGNDDQYRVESAKLLTLLLFTLRGTVYIYQGDEIGMTNVAFDSFDDYNDVEIRNTYHEWVEKGLDTNKLLKAVHISGRDNARTPVQWNDTPNAGFTTEDPWLKINPNYKSINVESQEKDKNSILNFCRQVIQFRKSHLTLVYGEFLIIQPHHPDIFAYKRWDDDKAYLVLLNFSDHGQLFQVDDKILSGNPECLITNYNDKNQFDLNNKIELRPWEGIMFEILSNG